MTRSEWQTEEYERNRQHLQAVAYRMLGSASEAEDAVQEAWLRLSRSDTEAVENLAGGDLEVDAFHRLDAAGVGLAELGHFDCVHLAPFGQSQLPRFVRQGDDGFERGDVT